MNIDFKVINKKLEMIFIVAPAFCIVFLSLLIPLEINGKKGEKLE